MSLRNLPILFALLLVGCGSVDAVPSPTSSETGVSETGIAVDDDVTTSQPPAEGQMKHSSIKVGTSSYFVDDNRGNRFSFECADNIGGTVDTIIGGEFVPDNGVVKFDVDGVTVPFRVKGYYDAQSTHGVAASKSIWSRVRNGRVLTVTYPDGSSHRFGLKNASTVMSPKFCGTNGAAVDTGPELENDDEAVGPPSALSFDDLTSDKFAAFLGDRDSRCEIGSGFNAPMVVTRFNDSQYAGIVYSAGRPILLKGDSAPKNGQMTLSGGGFKFQITLDGSLEPMDESGDVERGTGSLTDMSSGSFVPVWVKCMA